MARAEIRGFGVYYEQHGEGDTVVLLHHGFGCTKMWTEVWPLLTAAGYKVVLYDRRGYGRSDPGTDFAAFYVSDGFRAACVQELETLRSLLALERFHLVGQCEGGVLAVDFAMAHPDRVTSVTMSSTQCFSTMTMAAFNILTIPKSFSELAPALREKLIAWHGGERAEAFYEQFRTYGGEYGAGHFDLRPALPFVKCPALVIYPDRSHFFPVEQGLALYRGLGEAELAVLPNCKHNTYEEQPTEYARLITDFLHRQQ